MFDALSASQFVSLFRSVAPYINLFRGKTFVVAFGGKAISGPFARALAYDVNLLAALGVRLVLVHGARPQIEEEVREKGLESKFHAGYRVTDAAALDCVIDVVGSVSLEIDALLSQGLPDTPMANSMIRVRRRDCWLTSSRSMGCSSMDSPPSASSWDLCSRLATARR